MRCGTVSFSIFRYIYSRRYRKLLREVISQNGPVQIDGPIGRMGYQPKMNDPFKECITYSAYTFAFFPHKSHASGERIWGRMAYRHTARESWYDGIDYHHRWYTPAEYLLGRLKGEIK